jgi:NAD(P)-dependent dehydrogenase (short-subunit alcohol dehydrogenase family)
MSSRLLQESPCWTSAPKPWQLSKRRSKSNNADRDQSCVECSPACVLHCDSGGVDDVVESAKCRRDFLDNLIDPTNVIDEHRVNQVVQEVATTFGRLDYVVNAAGIRCSGLPSIEDRRGSCFNMILAAARRTKNVPVRLT